MNPACPKCNGNSVKNGFVNQIQRWKCKDCHNQFRLVPPRGKPLWMKLESVLLYSSGMSTRSTAAHLQVSPQTISDWIKAFSDANPVEIPEAGSFVVLELDEMWHFIEKNARNAGYGKYLTVRVGDCLLGNWETAVLKR
jgi:transposase-like protein